MLFAYWDRLLVKQVLLVTHLHLSMPFREMLLTNKASCLASSQRLRGYLVCSGGLPVLVDSSSIPLYSFHGAHLGSTTVPFSTTVQPYVWSKRDGSIRRVGQMIVSSSMAIA